ncbi:YjcZ family sporulation protein [Bacillus sp. MM2020_1]|nr:YjcZ family sporulation protein [Bacillus sp. MM2020_1]
MLGYCGYGYDGYDYGGYGYSDRSTFVLIVVLFMILIIVNAFSFWSNNLLLSLVFIRLSIMEELPLFWDFLYIYNQLRLFLFDFQLENTIHSAILITNV